MVYTPCVPPPSECPWDLGRLRSQPYDEVTLHAPGEELLQRSSKVSLRWSKGRLAWVSWTLKREARPSRREGKDFKQNTFHLALKKKSTTSRTARGQGITYRSLGPQSQRIPKNWILLRPCKNLAPGENTAGLTPFAASWDPEQRAQLSRTWTPWPTETVKKINVCQF